MPLFPCVLCASSCAFLVLCMGKPNLVLLRCVLDAFGSEQMLARQVALWQGNLSEANVDALYRKFRNPAAHQRQQEGPEGCNIYINNLPAYFMDFHLWQLFLNFGEIVSAKVFIDKHTHQSKCFGFVSFANRQSASLAISSMNGVVYDGKRLAVSLKRRARLERSTSFPSNLGARLECSTSLPSNLGA
eukprot:scpid95202/ scgid5818/ CUGBP Elav-like family member 6; Bruno-like protein 6; CUG-BP- and ETR-3-like factor 6; RNA-binding protein BRUNOL-6